MKTTLFAAAAALAIACAPAAFAGEGNGDPFALHLGAIATTHFGPGYPDQATYPYAASAAPAYQVPMTAEQNEAPRPAQPLRRPMQRG